MIKSGKGITTGDYSDARTWLEKELRQVNASKIVGDVNLCDSSSLLDDRSLLSKQ